ncbi:MAG: DUF4038 domain-containing protein [Erysipelotrichaceae bacterium]|nr:DUF4038 domain-containing protein [Erysipelotrichaceae bacterium]
MTKLVVNEQKNGFELNGKPFFYLGDTVWSVFTNATLDEWAYYLKIRKSQGINVLQINTLPQWDRCLNETGLYPFKCIDDQVFDFNQWNQEYYDRAKLMCKMAVEQGFQLALVVLWTNYVPGTWGSAICKDNIMPYNVIDSYVAKTVNQFEEFDPMYIVSGDTGFDSDESISHYQQVLNSLNKYSPDSLKAFHIKRGYHYIPKEFLNDIDFYMFQSGHNRDQQNQAYLLAEEFINHYPKKPIINAEPCYEQMGYSRQLYGRFTQEDVRKAAWTSLLAGASAGITYGAHGIWNWEKSTEKVNKNLGEGFDSSDPWYKAILYPGAWDYGFIKYLLEDYQITSISSKQDILINNTDEIRIGKTNNNIYLVYLPHTTKIKLKQKFNNPNVKIYDLQNGRIANGEIISNNEETIISQHPFEQDALILVKE